jgi:hypothetical protein
MAKTITMSLPHDLSEDEVKRRLVKSLADARSRFPSQLKDAKETWAGNRMNFNARAMGQTIAGFIEIQPKAVNVSVDLPFVLGLLAGKIRPQIEAEGRKLLK